jgi:periplasmic divalent cation tolerance protein
MQRMRDEDAIVVLCTVPVEGDHGERVARGLVENKLAACVNVIGPVRSIYRWQEAIQDDRELQLIIKTRVARYHALEKWLRENHPYSEPEIVALPIVRGSTSYLAWLTAQTE